MPRPEGQSSTVRLTTVGCFFLIAAVATASSAFADETEQGRTRIIAQIDDTNGLPNVPPPAPAASPAMAPTAASPESMGTTTSPPAIPALQALQSPPSTELAPFATACGGACCCTDLLDFAPSMIGGVFGAGAGSINFSNIPHAQIARIQMPSPAESILGRQTIADDSSPLPRDRFFFDYDYVYNVPFDPAGEAVNRFTPGFEKTFFDGAFSAEVRVPFGTTLDNDLLVKSGHVVKGITRWNYRTGQDDVLGNVTVGAKALLYRRPDELAISAGLFVTVPTANDLAVTGLLSPLHAPSATLQVKNESVHIAPYVGSLWTPTARLFVQGFFQLDFDANGQDVVLENGPSSTDLGRLRDQPFAFFDLGVGYWINHEEGVNWAAQVEVHYNASLQSPSTINVSPAQINLGAADGNINLVDLVLGTNLQLHDNATFMIAYVFAVGAGGDEQFSREVRASFNWHF